MGTVKVRYVHQLVQITGRSEESLQLNTPATVRDLLAALIERYGVPFRREIELESRELGEKSAFYLVFVDGKKIPEAQMDRPLIADQSTVSFLPLLGGG